MKNLLPKIILIALLTFSYNTLFSQLEKDTLKQEQNVIIKMNNGDKYEGTIISRDSETIVLKTINGEINLIASNVSSFVNSNKKHQFANPHVSRYFFSPSGVPIKKGTGYYRNILFTTNYVNYGITEKLSLGGGFEFISTVIGAPIWYLTPKLGFNVSENIHAAGGLFIAGIGISAGALGYGVLTVGKTDSNFSIGTGYGFFGGDALDYPVFMLSGTHRISNSLALITENYFLSIKSEEIIYLGIHGIRILFSEKDSVDIGVVFRTISENDISLLRIFPYLGYARMF